MDDKRKLKGISKAVIKKGIFFQQYKDCLFNQSALYVQQYNLRSFQHVVVSTQATKIALRPFDTKRWILDDGIHSLAHGHWKIPKVINGSGAA